MTPNNEKELYNRIIESASQMVIKMLNEDWFDAVDDIDDNPADEVFIDLKKKVNVSNMTFAQVMKCIQNLLIRMNNDVRNDYKNGNSLRYKELLQIILLSSAMGTIDPKRNYSQKKVIAFPVKNLNLFKYNNDKKDKTNIYSENIKYITYINKQLYVQSKFWAHSAERNYYGSKIKTSSLGYWKKLEEFEEELQSSEQLKQAKELYEELYNYYISHQ